MPVFKGLAGVISRKDYEEPLKTSDSNIKHVGYRTMWKNIINASFCFRSTVNSLVAQYDLTSNRSLKVEVF